MRLTLVRSGGVTGIRKETTVDTGRLDPARARAVEECVGRCGFFDLPGRVGEGKPQPDRFQLALTVEDGARSHTVRFSEKEVPQGLDPVLDLLRRP